MRTTLDIDTPLLREIRQIMRRESRSMGAVVSELLAEGLARRRGNRPTATELRWIARPMHARVDLSDKEAVYKVLDRSR